MNADEKDVTAVELALYKSLYEKNYLGYYKSLIDFAKELLFDNNDISEWIIDYVDWERIGKDWESNQDVFTVKTNDGIHVFLRFDKEMNL
jgi:hypothetical protein